MQTGSLLNVFFIESLDGMAAKAAAAKPAETCGLLRLRGSKQTERFGDYLIQQIC